MSLSMPEWSKLVRDTVAQVNTQRQGFKQGGLIPGAKDLLGGDNTTIRAKTGEYVLPEEFVDYVGVENIDKDVAHVKKKLGLDPKGHLKRKTGYVTGGYIEDDPNKKLGLQATGSAVVPEQAPVGIVPPVDKGYGTASFGGKTINYADIGTKQDPLSTGSAGFSVATGTPALAPTMSLDQGGLSPDRAGLPEGLKMDEFIAKYGQGKDPGAMMQFYEKLLQPSAASAGVGLAQREGAFGQQERIKKLGLEEALLPARKEYYSGRGEEARAGAGLKRKKEATVTGKPEKRTETEKDTIKGLNTELEGLRRKQDKISEYSPGGKQRKTDNEARQKEIKERLDKEFGIKLGATGGQNRPASFDDFTKKVRAAGSKMSDAELKEYFTQKYGSK